METNPTLPMNAIPFTRDELRVLYDAMKYHVTADDVYKNHIRHRVAEKIKTAISMLGAEEGDVNGSL